MTNVKQAVLSILPRSSSTTGIEENLIVHLEPCSRQPVTPVERTTVSVLTREGALPLDGLVERVASELYREELRSGAGLLDIGLFGSRLFVADVISEIQARNGTLWRIEKPQER